MKRESNGRMAVMSREAVSRDASISRSVERRERKPILHFRRGPSTSPWCGGGGRHDWHARSGTEGRRGHARIERCRFAARCAPASAAAKSGCAAAPNATCCWRIGDLIQREHGSIRSHRTAQISKRRSSRIRAVLCKPFAPCSGGWCCSCCRRPPRSRRGLRICLSACLSRHHLRFPTNDSVPARP